MFHCKTCTNVVEENIQLVFVVWELILETGIFNISRTPLSEGRDERVKYLFL